MVDEAMQCEKVEDGGQVGGAPDPEQPSQTESLDTPLLSQVLLRERGREGGKAI